MVITFISIEAATPTAIRGSLILVVDGAITLGTDRLDRLDAAPIDGDSAVVSATDHPAIVAVIASR